MLSAPVVVKGNAEPPESFSVISESQTRTSGLELKQKCYSHYQSKLVFTLSSLIPSPKATLAAVASWLVGVGESFPSTPPQRWHLVNLSHTYNLALQETKEK